MFGDPARALAASLLLVVEDLAFRIARRSLRCLRPLPATVRGLRRIAAPTPRPAPPAPRPAPPASPPPASPLPAPRVTLAPAHAVTWFVPGDPAHVPN